MPSPTNAPLLGNPKEHHSLAKQEEFPCRWRWRGKRWGGSTATGATAELGGFTLHRESTIWAYTQAVSAPPTITTNLCLSRQEQPSQSLLRWGICALTHKHRAQDPPKYWVFQRHHCRHSCAVQAGQGVTEVSKILRAANCLVTMLFTVQVAFDYKGWQFFPVALGSESYKSICTWLVSRETGRVLGLFIKSANFYAMCGTLIFFSLSSLPNYSI